MARIRTIKPEFPQSETIGALSRDARLLFVQLWTIVDDAGRARASSRVLASVLYPFDDDAMHLIEGWLQELEDQGCIRRYTVEGKPYLDVPKWLEHQKIDRPSKSKLPEFVEASRGIASNREGSMLEYRSKTLDHGPRTVDQGPRTREQNLAAGSEYGGGSHAYAPAREGRDPTGDDAFGDPDPAAWDDPSQFGRDRSAGGSR